MTAERDFTPHAVGRVVQFPRDWSNREVVARLMSALRGQDDALVLARELHQRVHALEHKVGTLSCCIHGRDHALAASDDDERSTS